MARLGLSPGTAPGKKKKPDPRQRGPALRPGLSPPGKTKAPMIPRFRGENHSALAQWLWLIFTLTIDSRRQNLQYSGKSFSTVVGSTGWCVDRPQNGQTSFPFADTNSISCFRGGCKRFCPPFPVFK